MDTFAVYDVTTDTKVSKDLGEFDSARRLCAAYNTPDSGGRYDVYRNGKRITV